MTTIDRQTKTAKFLTEPWNEITPNLEDRSSRIRPSHFHIEEHLPNWIYPLIVKLEGVLDLKPNWDSYGSLPIDPAYIDAAIRLLWTTMPSEMIEPQVIPTSNGRVQLEWHENGIDLEIEFVSLHRLNILFEDSNTGESLERELTADVAPLVACLMKFERGNGIRA